MTGLLLQIGATKLAVSVVLAGLVWMVHRRVRRPAVSYPLWLLVLVTLLVPAVVSVPVLPAELVAPVPAPGAGSDEVVLAERAIPNTSPDLRLGALAPRGIAILWLLGTVGLLVWTPVRTIRFRRTLARALRTPPEWLQRLATEISQDLGLSRTPEVYTTGARVTPMVWWAGGQVRVLVPAFLLTDMSREELRAILAHELAHVRRRDHLVRWLEWVACSVFWWNPVAWWARRELRTAEESCCDRLALKAGNCCPRTYAKALLRIAAGAAKPRGFRPPLAASATGGVENTKVLERRIRMIVSTDTLSPAPRRLRAVVRLATVCALPFGLVYCDRPMAPMSSDEETGLDPVEGAALESPDEVSARTSPEHMTFVEEFLRDPFVSSGDCRQCHVGLPGVTLDGLRVGYVPPAPTMDLPRLKAALAEMQELIEEINRTPDAEERFEDWSRRIEELSRRIDEANGNRGWRRDPRSLGRRNENELDFN